MEITPDLIAVGIAHADRKTLCSLLALFTDVNLPTLMWSQGKDLVRRLDRREPPLRKEQSALVDRIGQTANTIDSSSASDACLRLQLWMHLRNAVGLDPGLTFSSTGIHEITRDFGDRVPEVFAAQLNEEKIRQIPLLSTEYWRNHAAQRLNPFSTPDLGTLEFGEVVQKVALRTLAAAAKRGDLPDDMKSELVERVRKEVESLGPEARKKLLDSVGVDALSDSAALKILLGGGGLAGIGVAVEVSGFAAYILAAQASAFIPLVGGKMLVSTLAVLSSPWFIVPALLVGGGALSNSTQKRLREAFVPTAASVLAIHAVSTGAQDARLIVEIFRGLPKHLPPQIVATWSAERAKRRAVRFDLREGSLALLGQAADWAHARVWAEPFPDAAAYLDEFERLGGAFGSDSNGFGRVAEKDGLAEALETPIAVSPEDPLREALFGDSRARGASAAHAGLTFGDLLYDMAAIDPRVIRAADFARSEDIGDRFSFAIFAERFQGLTGAPAIGASANLQGYVAEQVVAARLVEMGHQVSFPRTPNQEGFDLLVDGERFQVKCTDSVSGLEEHFDRYPDIPVLANSEMVARVADRQPEWADHVYAVDGYSLEGVESLMNDSLEAGAEAVDYEVPLFSAVVMAGSGIVGWWNGEVGITDAMADMAAGVAAKTGLGTAGAIAGKAAGLLFFGPAGAVVFGGVLAVAAASQSHRFVGAIRDWTNQSLASELRRATSSLVEAVVAGLETKINILKDKRSQVGGVGPLSDYLLRRFDDQITYFNERLSEAQRFDLSKKSAVAAALKAIDLARRSKVHVFKLQEAYRALLASIAKMRTSRNRWGFPTKHDPDPGQAF